MTEEELGFLHKDQDAALHSIIQIFQEIIPGNPPLGLRPLRIFQRTQNEGPITNAVFDTNFYFIGLTVPDRRYNQMSYQFAHEFCHVYADPLIANWVIESICEAMSIHILKCMEKKWSRSTIRWQRDYAHHFSGYIGKNFRKTHREVLGIDNATIDKQTLSDWFGKIPPNLRTSDNKKLHRIVAEIALPILESTNSSWTIIPFLGKASSPHPRSLKDLVKDSEFNFDELVQVIPKNARNTVQKLRGILLL